MPVTKVGLNLTALENITVPDFGLNRTASEILEDIPRKANEVTGGFYGLIVLVVLFIFLWWKLQQVEVIGGDFGYDQFRAVGIASGVCSILGIYCLNVGLFVNFYHIVIFIVITFIMAGVVWKQSK